MTTDQSWLYSTIAQSSAAIIAIVGGFIPASVLMLRAEKRSLVKRLEWLNSYTKSSLAPITENIEELKREIPTLEARIKAFSYTPNLKMGAYVLGFLAVFGIITPVIIIANEAFYSWAKWLTTGLFCLGVIGVFTYIGFQIRTLMR